MLPGLPNHQRRFAGRREDGQQAPCCERNCFQAAELSIALLNNSGEPAPAAAANRAGAGAAHQFFNRLNAAGSHSQCGGRRCCASTHHLRSPRCADGSVFEQQFPRSAKGVDLQRRERAAAEQQAHRFREPLPILRGCQAEQLPGVFPEHEDRAAVGGSERAGDFCEGADDARHHHLLLRILADAHHIPAFELMIGDDTGDAIAGFQIPGQRAEPRHILHDGQRAGSEAGSGAAEIGSEDSQPIGRRAPPHPSRAAAVGCGAPAEPADICRTDHTDHTSRECHDRGLPRALLSGRFSQESPRLGHDLPEPQTPCCIAGIHRQSAGADDEQVVGLLALEGQQVSLGEHLPAHCCGGVSQRLAGGGREPLPQGGCHRCGLVLMHLRGLFSRASWGAAGVGKGGRPSQPSRLWMAFATVF